MDPAAQPARCLICGYALDGLDPGGGGGCPECNFPIARSLRGDLLLDSSPSHLTLLRLGAKLVFWGVVTFTASIAGFFGYVWATDNMTETVAWMVLCGIIAACLVFFGGWFLLTARDRSSFTPGIQTMRRATRLAVLATSACLTLIGVGFWFTWLAGDFIFDRGDLLSYLFGALLAVTPPLALATMILSMLYLRRWSRRLPDNFIYKRAHFIMWGWPALPVLQAVLLGGFQFLLATLLGPGPSNLYIIAFVLFFASLLTFIILYAHLIARTILALSAVRAASLAGQQVGEDAHAPAG